MPTASAWVIPMLMTSSTTSSCRVLSLVCLWFISSFSRTFFVYDLFTLYYRSLLCLGCLVSRNLAVQSVNYPSLFIFFCLRPPVSGSPLFGLRGRDNFKIDEAKRSKIYTACGDAGRLGACRCIKERKLGFPSSTRSE